MEDRRIGGALVPGWPAVAATAAPGRPTAGDPGCAATAVQLCVRVVHDVWESATASVAETGRGPPSAVGLWITKVSGVPALAHPPSAAFFCLQDAAATMFAAEHMFEGPTRTAFCFGGEPACRPVSSHCEGDSDGSATPSVSSPVAYQPAHDKVGAGFRVRMTPCVPVPAPERACPGGWVVLDVAEHQKVTCCSPGFLLLACQDVSGGETQTASWASNGTAVPLPGCVRRLLVL